MTFDEYMEDDRVKKLREDMYGLQTSSGKGSLLTQMA
jgi:hypothetical protein